MKKLNDEEIQRLLESELKPSGDSLSADEQKSLEQYQLLFEKLKEEPKEGLPYNFASKVKARLQAQLNRKKDIQFYLISLVVFVLGFAAFYELLKFVNANAGDQFIAVTFKFKWIVILGAILFLGILFCDQKLIKERAIKN
jgi:hypothetical protein